MTVRVAINGFGRIGRLVLTPHSAFFTPQSMRDIRRLSARTAGRYLRDGRLENCVNASLLAR